MKCKDLSEFYSPPLGLFQSISSRIQPQVLLEYFKCSYHEGIIPVHKVGNIPEAIPINKSQLI